MKCTKTETNKKDIVCHEKCYLKGGNDWQRGQENFHLIKMPKNEEKEIYENGLMKTDSDSFERLLCYGSIWILSNLSAEM